jgi:hypothetical protein
MIYDQQNIFNRIKAVLPARWFGEDTPIIDSVLNVLSSGWVGLFVLLNYTKMQTRISTASNGWLDLIAKDFFDHRIMRRQRETDNSFRTRIYAELLRDRCTRAAIYDLLTDLTGRPPVIFEPTNPQDTGCYGSMELSGIGNAGYGVAGGWGNLNVPFQVFVRAFRAETAGVAMVNGWGGSLGGYGAGLSAYVGLEMNSSQADDFEIYQSVSNTSPVATIIWMSIEP